MYNIVHKNVTTKEIGDHYQLTTKDMTHYQASHLHKDM